jgi:hypothetical protein
MLKEVFVFQSVMMGYSDKIKFAKMAVHRLQEHQMKQIYVFQCVKQELIYIMVNANLAV